MKTSPLFQLPLNPLLLCLLTFGLLSSSTHLMAQEQGRGGQQEQAILAFSKEIHQGWEFQRQGDSKWKPVEIPSPFENHEGVGFNGVGSYRKRILRLDRPSSPKETAKRMVLRFNGVATKTTVSCDGVLVAEHLGGWTPLECDITDFLFKQTATSQPPQSESTHCELVVQVDEMVGHNSQGFLPVFAPHFGGIWQSIQAAWVNPVWIDTRELFVWGDIASNELKYEIPLIGLNIQSVRNFISPHKRYRVCLKYRLPSTEQSKEADWNEHWNEHWVELNGSQITKLQQDGKVSIHGSVGITNPIAWNTDSPVLYDVQVGLEELTANPSESPNDWIDLRDTYAAFREVRAQGPGLLLNGHPLTVRGILNWGYAPPSVAPSLDPEHWRRELQLVKDYGFNLMKFCLWIPPKGYLELADRMGVLVWIEYPTWHSQWTKDALPSLEKEFDEFFCYDRNHPSVVLRSLTCETGPSADIEVIRKLYDLCHQRIPGSIVEDDSSWIQWNRVHDFYDDHPYGNNHTWIPTLKRLENYIQEHGVKPLVLGEAIAADTWVPPGSLDAMIPSDGLLQLQGVQRGEASDPRIEPFWMPLAYQANLRWMQSRELDMGRQAVERLEQDSKRYALLMRKFQIETLRRELPNAGYVVSVIRDFPFAAMGLVDFKGEPKWTNQDWDWHGQHMLSLRTPGDRRSFWAGEEFKAQICINRSYKTESKDCLIRWTWNSGSVSISKETTVTWQVGLQNSNQQILELNEMPPAADQANKSEPVLWKLSLELLDPSKASEDRLICKNRWELWQIPSFDIAPTTPTGRRANRTLCLHESCSTETANKVRGLANRIGRNVIEVKDPKKVPRLSDTLWITQRIDPALLDLLEQGGQVLLIPDGTKGSLATSEHWFLRGGPIISSDPHWNGLHRLLVDLQHFDLASPVVPDLNWLGQLKPIVMLWDNHDIATVKTHGLLFATRIGKGLMLVDCLNHGDGKSAAGALLFEHALSWLDSDAANLAPSILPKTLQAMRNKFHEKTVSLIDQPWQFRPDPKDSGLELGWQRTRLDDSQQAGWNDIAIGRHWESAGYPSLDGWAWYRTEVTIPEDWPEGPVYLQIDGADDYIEAFANGIQIGTAGDREKRKTAFEVRSSFLAIPKTRAGDRLTIAIRVEDWQGAGGLFRPIRLSTTELDQAESILK